MSIFRTGYGASYTICTAATHPSSPHVGDKLFETDTGLELTYQSATTGWTPPWDTAWGAVALATITSSTQTTVSANVDITGLSATFNAVGNRAYRTSMFIEVASSVSGQVAIAMIVDGGGSALQRNEHAFSAIYGESMPCALIETGLAAGSTTRKGQLQRAVGAGTLSLGNANAVRPYYILIEDIGSNGVPL